MCTGYIVRPYLKCFLYGRDERGKNRTRSNQKHSLLSLYGWQIYGVTLLLLLLHGRYAHAQTTCLPLFPATYPMQHYCCIVSVLSIQFSLTLTLLSFSLVRFSFLFLAHNSPIYLFISIFFCFKYQNTYIEMCVIKCERVGNRRKEKTKRTRPSRFNTWWPTHQMQRDESDANGIKCDKTKELMKNETERRKNLRHIHTARNGEILWWKTRLWHTK